jgi:hypothetical protein
MLAVEVNYFKFYLDQISFKKTYFGGDITNFLHISYCIRLDLEKYMEK